jgi:hypothetical protein
MAFPEAVALVERFAREEDLHVAHFTGFQGYALKSLKRFGRVELPIALAAHVELDHFAPGTRSGIT